MSDMRAALCKILFYFERKSIFGLANQFVAVFKSLRMNNRKYSTDTIRV